MKLTALEDLIANNINKPTTMEKYKRNAQQIEIIKQTVQSMDLALVNVVAGMLVFDSLLAMFYKQLKEEGKEIHISDISTAVKSYMDQVWEDMSTNARMAHIQAMFDELKKSKDDDTMGMRPH